jgi:hypothetical protein
MIMQSIKRKIAAALALLPFTSVLMACTASAMGQRPNQASTRDRFEGIGLTLVVDAVPGAEMLGNEFFADGSERRFYASGVTRKGNRSIMAFPSGKVPESVRVVWRKGDRGHLIPWGDAASRDEMGKANPNYVPGVKKFNAEEEIARRKMIMSNLGKVQQGPWGSGYGDEVVGDYTFPVASRIPDAVPEEIRKNGGGLRLKFRLKPDGVLFGWDIERTPAEARNYSQEEIRSRNMYFPSEYHQVGGDFLDTRY